MQLRLNEKTKTRRIKLKETNKNINILSYDPPIVLAWLKILLTLISHVLFY